MPIIFHCQQQQFALLQKKPLSSLENRHSKIHYFCQVKILVVGHFRVLFLAPVTHAKPYDHFFITDNGYLAVVLAPITTLTRGTRLKGYVLGRRSPTSRSKRTKIVHVSTGLLRRWSDTFLSQRTLKSANGRFLRTLRDT